MALEYDEPGLQAMELPISGLEETPNGLLWKDVAITDMAQRCRLSKNEGRSRT
jgi:hypothetical protein